MRSDVCSSGDTQNHACSIVLYSLKSFFQSHGRLEEPEKLSGNRADRAVHSTITILHLRLHLLYIVGAFLQDFSEYLYPYFMGVSATQSFHRRISVNIPIRTSWVPQQPILLHKNLGVYSYPYFVGASVTHTFCIGYAVLFMFHFVHHGVSQYQ